MQRITRRGHLRSRCSAIQPAKRPKVEPTEDELFDGDEDKKHIKVEDDRVVGEGAERAEPAAPEDAPSGELSAPPISKSVVAC